MHRFKLKLLYLFCCLLMATGLAAQDASYFVYIQHEKQLPFYVKVDGKVLSSSIKGYVILPKLQEGKVPVTIGFPKNESPEQQFVLRLNGSRDYGYLLKNVDDKEYALYDLQTFATLKSSTAGSSGETTVTRVSSEHATKEQKELINQVQSEVETALSKKTDTPPPVAGESKKKGSFAQALDKVVTDDRPDDMPVETPVKPKPTPVAETPIAVTPPPAATETEAPAKKPRGRKNGRKDREGLTEEEQALLHSVMEDEKKAAADEAVAEAPKEEPKTTTEQPVEETPVKKEKKVRKKKDQPEPEFINFGETTAPAAAGKTVEKAAEAAPVITEEKTDMSAKEVRDAKRQKRKAEREAGERAAFVKDSIANADFNTTSAETSTRESKLKMINSDCGKILEVDAFRKLLRTMNGKKSDADMVDAFRKGTRSVCVSTEQVRALAQLISAEESRYQLLDAAYARTYDTQNFGTLSDLLREDYYKGRFRAMIRK